MDGCGSNREEREWREFTATCCERCCSSVCPTSSCIIQLCPASVRATSVATWPATATADGAVTVPSPYSCCWTCRARTLLPAESPPARCCRSARSLWHCRSSRSGAAANKQRWTAWASSYRRRLSRPDRVSGCSNGGDGGGGSGVQVLNWRRVKGCGLNVLCACYVTEWL